MGEIGYAFAQFSFPPAMSPMQVEKMVKILEHYNAAEDGHAVEDDSDNAADSEEEKLALALGFLSWTVVVVELCCACGHLCAKIGAEMQPVLP